MPLSHKQLRQHLRQQRQSLAPSQQHLHSVRIAIRIQPFIASHSTIASYSSIGSEVSTNYLHKLLLRRGIKVLLPIVQAEHKLVFVSWNKNNSFYNKYGIAEPRYSAARLVPLSAINTLVVPLLGFDQQCHRIGMGGGFYDRLLKKQHRARLLGIAYKQQQLRRITPQPWDQNLQAIITPRQGLVRLRQK